MTTTKMGGGRRRMKQMQGLLLLSRLDESPTRRHQSGKIKPQRVTVVLQPQMLELAYSSLADQDMLRPLGRIDLRDAKLEQVPDGFIIYEAGNGLRKKFKLQDKDKATTDAWFFAVYTAITEYERLPISFSEDIGHKFSAVLTSSMRDEHTEAVEFELSCQLVLPARPIDKPSIKWKVWKTFSDLQAFDDELRVSFGVHMTQIEFPRDRKRDSLFGGMRKKSLQELKEQQLALYVELVFQMPEISTEPVLVGKVKQFLGFDSFFEIVASPSSENGENDIEVPDALTSPDPIPEPHVSKFAETEISELSEPTLSNEPQSVGQSAIEPLSNKSNASSSQYSSTESTRALPALLRRTSPAALEDESEEFVEIIPETHPKAAKRLHKKIIQTVRELVSYDEERVQDFQDQTKDFGREKTSAMEYCAFLLGAVGAQECCKLIPEMAKLLPDEVKREELMQARAAIWRRTHRRHRRRSKQFSESVVLQKQKEEQQQADTVHSRMRPKSDSLSALTERVLPLQIPGRSSMVERPMPAIDTESHSEPDNSASAIPGHRAGIADPRRHLNRRASFNTMFGETLPIKEENPAENESDDDSDDSLLGRPRTVSKETLSIDRKVENAKTRPSDLGRRNSSFLGEDDNDESTEDDEEHHQTISSDELQDAWEKVKAMTILPEPPEPKLPTFGPKVPMKSKLHSIQSLITSLEYNYTGTLYFDVNKNRSFKSIVNTAKEILKEGLPIQCLEAVFLGAYLTAGLTNLERFPISFKTTAGRSTHRHIVLGIHHQQQKWGALGLSRCEKLMNKDLKFESLSDLVLDYCHEFENVYHTVLKVNVGFPFTHDIHSSERVLNLPVNTNNWTEVAKQLDGFGKDAAEIESFKKAKGVFPAWFGTRYALNAPEVELGRSPRAAQRRNSFSDDFNTFEEELQTQEPAPAQTPRTIPKHIIVTPDEFTFKKPSAKTTPAPPTNIFLQNTSPSPYLIEIEDRSGLLEIVTKTQPTLQTEERDKTNPEAHPAKATFRISASGMIAVAIKYNPHRSVTTKLTSPEKSPVKKGVNDAVPDGESFTLETPFVFKDI
ncbi:hypothetical protein JG687_00005875 [Phytophthora cactorum]|uniref:Uncharacterized protein n=1 Tax=Phytophthora cactorum TaxID=29920 RepID=A0A8T1UJL4_9STRA|nr:hypothetical protein JG687_00005875 [Phytophthora cactorum]